MPRAWEVGPNNSPKVPFACTDRGSYQSSEFDFNGEGVAGKSSGDPMVVPEDRFTNSNRKVILEIL